MGGWKIEQFNDPVPMNTTDNYHGVQRRKRSLGMVMVRKRNES